MQQALQIGFYLALAGVFVILVLGVVNLARTDEGRVSRSNRLMRLRVLLQAIAILMLVGLGFVAGVIRIPGMGGG
jgi:hypothetical protein